MLSAFQLAAQETETVKLTPAFTDGGPVIVGGGAGATAVLHPNMPLVRRVALKPGDVTAAELSFRFDPPGARMEPVAKGSGGDGTTVSLTKEPALRAIPLKAGEELAITVWKSSPHENGGGRIGNLRIVQKDAAATLPPGIKETRHATAAGVLTFVTLTNRDRFPLVADREEMRPDGKGGFTAPRGWGASAKVDEAGVLQLHTNGRGSPDPKYGWAPAVVFTAAADGVYAVEGELQLRVSKPNMAVSWIVGRLKPKGAALAGTTVSFYQNPPAGTALPQEAKPVFQIPLGAPKGGQRATVSTGLPSAFNDWLATPASANGLLVRATAANGAPAAVSITPEPAGSLTVKRHPRHLLFDHPVKPRDGVYARMKDGALYYGDSRLRLWSMVKDGSGERFRQLGFNGWRAWFSEKFYDPASAKAGGAMAYRPGDGSPLDYYDSMFADMKKNGIFVMFATLIGVGMEPKYFAAEDGWMQKLHGREPGWKQWSEAARKSNIWLCDQMAFADDWLWEVRLRHARNVLDHRNPHTGRRYAEEEAIALIEVNNEAAHVKHWIERGFGTWPEYFQNQLRKKWTAWLAAKYRSNQALEKAWGTVPAGETLTGKAARIELKPGAVNSQRRLDFQRFLMELIDQRNRDYIAFCRSQAPAGKGASVVPFSCDSMYRPSIPWAWANWNGDSSTVSMYFWSNGTMLAAPPALYVMDSHRLDGRISTIYETGRGRPSPYRAETPYMLSVFGDWQDFDIISWHGSWIGGASNESLLAGTAAPVDERHFWNGVHLECDPVINSAAAMAGRLYLAGVIGRAEKPAIYDIGRDGIFGTAAWDGVGGRDMSRRVFTRGARIRLNPTRTGEPVLVDGAAPAPEPPDSGPIQTGPYTTWDWQHERLIIDAPTAKAYIGRTCESYRFKDGIVLSGFNTPWIAFSIISQDGKPLTEDSAKAWISAVADAKNTGFDYDYNCAGGPKEQAKAVRNRGHAPVVVDAVGYTLSFPRETQIRYTGYDFALRMLETRPPLDTNTLRMAPQSDWMGVLEFTGRGNPVAAVADASPGAPKAGVSDPTRKPTPERTDAALAPLWNPVPGLSWGDSYHRAHRVLRESAFTHGTASPEDFTDRKDKTIRMKESVFLTKMPAEVEVRYDGERMKRVLVTFEQAPAYMDLVALLTRQHGAPASQTLSPTADRPSETTWSVKSAAGTVRVTASEVQGVVRIDSESISASPSEKAAK